MKTFILTVLFIFTAAAHAIETGDLLQSYVSISKLPTERFAFQICQLSVCELIGSSQGYSAEQINGLHGTLKQIVGPIAGAAEAAVGAFLVAAGFPIGAGVGEAAGVAIPALGAQLGTEVGAFVVGPTVGAAIVPTIVHFVDFINPFKIYIDGRYSNKMAKGMKTLLKTELQNAEASVVIYSSAKPEDAVYVAKRVAIVLAGIKN